MFPFLKQLCFYSIFLFLFPARLLSLPPSLALCDFLILLCAWQSDEAFYDLFLIFRLHFCFSFCSYFFTYFSLLSYCLFPISYCPIFPIFKAVQGHKKGKYGAGDTGTLVSQGLGAPSPPPRSRLLFLTNDEQMSKTNGNGWSSRGVLFLYYFPLSLIYYFSCFFFPICLCLF